MLQKTCPISAKAVALLRYFYEELPDIYVIAAGSLLENPIGVRVSFPVGEGAIYGIASLFLS